MSEKTPREWSLDLRRRVELHSVEASATEMAEVVIGEAMAQARAEAFEEAAKIIENYIRNDMPPRNRVTEYGEGGLETAARLCQRIRAERSRKGGA